MGVERRVAAAWAMHPGEILKQEFLLPLRMSNYALAKALHVSPQRVNEIVLRKRGISAAMALRLARFLGTTDEFWLNLQSAYELARERRTSRKEIERIKPLRPRVA